MCLAKVVTIDKAVEEIVRLTEDCSRPVTIAVHGRADSGKTYLWKLMRDMDAVSTTDKELRTDCVRKAQYLMIHPRLVPLSRTDSAIGERTDLIDSLKRKLGKGLDLSILIQNPTLRDYGTGEELLEMYDLIILNYGSYEKTPH